jgi:hypothetical protein
MTKLVNFIDFKAALTLLLGDGVNDFQRNRLVHATRGVRLDVEKRNLDAVKYVLAGYGLDYSIDAPTPQCDKDGAYPYGAHRWYFIAIPAHQFLPVSLVGAARTGDWWNHTQNAHNMRE